MTSAELDLRTAFQALGILSVLSDLDCSLDDISYAEFVYALVYSMPVEEDDSMRTQLAY